MQHVETVGDAVDFVAALNRVTEDVRPSSGVDAASRRRAIGALLLTVWAKYNSSSFLKAPVDLADQLYLSAIHLIELARILQAATPIHEVTIGNMSDEADKSVQLLQTFGNWDTVIVETAQADGVSYERTQPLDAVQGVLVRRARELGASWRRIGEALGMSAQGIQQKAQDRGWVVGSSASSDD